MNWGPSPPPLLLSSSSFPLPFFFFKHYSNISALRCIDGTVFLLGVFFILSYKISRGGKTRDEAMARVGCGRPKQAGRNCI